MIKFLQQLNPFTKTLLAASLCLVVYGYLARLTGIYFFWESDSIGWTLFLLAVIVFLYNRIRLKRAMQKKVLGEKLVIGLIIFVFLLQAILIAVIPDSDAYAAAKSFLKNDPAVKAEVGNVTGFGLIPIGSMQQSSGPGGTYGSASISLILKGDKKYKEITVLVIKLPDNLHWQVEAIE